MIVVDSHCHVAESWYEPVELLLQQMERNGVQHAVLVQILGQANNSYQQACLQRYPGRFASVVIVDTDRPDAAERLARLVEDGASGVRLRAGTRSPGQDPLAIWRAAARLGLTVTCAGSSTEFLSAEFAGLVEALPELRIVVEHLGATNRPADDPAEAERRGRIFELARFPNLYLKIHGLGEFARRAMPVQEPCPFERPIPPFLERAIQSFGPRRMLWGSDYPPVSSREGYATALSLPMAELAHLGEADRGLIFGGVALELFPIRS